MANVFDVAKYILSKTGSISTFKLQKLVYYCQAWSLVWDEAPLYKERIEAWANGPVVPTLYDQHRHMFMVSESDISGNVDAISEDAKETIDMVVRDYGQFSGGQLCEMVHQERPWLEARGSVPLGERCSNPIDLFSMKDYYSGLLVEK